MNSTPSKPSQLLPELEALHSLLHDSAAALPASAVDEALIPLLSDIIEPGPGIAGLSQPPQPVAMRDSPPAPTNPSAARLPDSRPATPVDSDTLRKELQAAAELILQDVIDDFLPQLQNELQRRLRARMERLLKS